MAYLEIHDADGVQEIQLSTDSYVVGREVGCDLVLDDRRASKKHCRFENKKGGWSVVDLASANGTWVEGVSISQVILEDGAEVLVGDVKFVFRKRRPQKAAVGSDERPSVAQERSRKSDAKNKVFIGIAAVAVIAAVAFVVLGGDKKTDSPDQTQAAVDQNVNGKVEPEDKTQTPEVKSDDDKLASLQERFKGLVKESPSLLLGELLEKAQQLEDDAKGTSLHREFASWKNGVERVYRDRYRGLVKSLDVQVASLEEQKGGIRFSNTLASADELLIELRANDLRDLEKDVRRLKLRLLKSARSLWEQRESTAQRSVAKGDFDNAKEELTWAAQNLSGTSFEGRARSELNLLDLKKSLWKSGGSATASSGSSSNDAASMATAIKGSPVVAKINKAEKLAAAREWQEAAAIYGSILADSGDSMAKENWVWRRDLLSGLATLKKALIVNVNAENKRVKTVRIGRLAARPFAADEDVVELKFGRAGVVTWKWRDMPTDKLLALLKAGVDSQDQWLAYARAAVEFGNDTVAMDMLLKAAKRKKLKASADKVYAHWRGVSVPLGGFVVAADSFMTPEEFADYESTLAARKMAKSVVSCRLKQLPDVVAQMRALGTPGLEPLQRGLRDRYKKREAEVEKLKIYTRPQGARQKVLAELDVRRKTAFALIFDTARYPYPYGPNQDKVQAEVDSLVQSVRSIYESPTTLLIDTNKALNALYDELTLVRSFMNDTLGPKPNPSDMLAKLDKKLDMRSYGRSDSDRKHNEEVMVFNAEIKSTITPLERECHRLTNEYRMLLGLRAVKIENALVLAARGHSQEMKDLGYFAHNSPTKGRETPSQRAQLSGWGGGCSENIARGQSTAKAAVDGWIGSSGHHRNILGRGWTHLGCGKAKDGNFWTQNFAKGASTKLSQEKIQPEGKKKKSTQG